MRARATARNARKRCMCALTRRRTAHSMKSLAPYIEDIDVHVREHLREAGVEDPRLEECARIAYNYSRAHNHLALAYHEPQLLGAEPRF